MLIFFFPSFFLLHMNYGDWTIGLRVYIALFIYFFRLLLLYEIVIIFRPFSTLCSIQGNRFSLRQNIKYIYVFSNFRYQPGKLRRKLVLLKLVRKKFSVERFFFFLRPCNFFHSMIYVHSVSSIVTQSYPNYTFLPPLRYERYAYPH